MVNGSATAELLRKGLQTSLRSEAFVDKLREVWLRFDEESTLRVPQEIYRSQVANLAAYPCCEIDVTVGRTIDNRESLAHIQYEVHFFWHDRHDIEEELEDFISRYLTATREFLTENPYVEGLGNPEPILQDEQFSPFVPENVYEGRPLLKSGLLIVLFEVFRNGRY